MFEVIFVIVASLVGAVGLLSAMQYHVYFDEMGCFICRSWFNQFKIKRVKKTKYNSKQEIKFSFHDKCLKEFLLSPEKYKTERIIRINSSINKIEEIMLEDVFSAAKRNQAITEAQSISKKLIWSNIQEGKPIEEFGENKGKLPAKPTFPKMQTGGYVTK